MVICGGLEILAAGYVINAMHKDDKKNIRRNSDDHRRKKRHDHSHSHSRPSRPPHQNSLGPPQQPYRPMSAPPPQSRPQQRPPQQWPAQARPPTKAEQAMWYGQQAGNSATHLPRPPPGPGHLQQAPTMHYDTKTGKWQSNMLPAGMQQETRSLSNVGLIEDGGKRSVSQPPEQDRRRRRQKPREGSYSSASSVTSDEDMAYGKMYASKVPSHERRRPSQQEGPPTRAMPPAAPVEMDWYATQKATTPAMAQALMNHSATNLSNSLYSQSQPNLAVYEMDGTGVGGSRWNAGSPRPQIPLELDGTERYRAYRP